MDVFGLEPVVATIVLTVVGILLQNIVGWLKSTEPFNVRNAAATGIVAFFVSAVVVSSVIGAIPDGADPLVVLGTIITVIAGVAGFDTLVKGGAKAAARASAKTE